MIILSGLTETPKTIDFICFPIIDICADKLYIQLKLILF